MNRWVASRHVDVAGISSASTAGMCTPEAYERQHMGDDGDGAKELLHAIARGGVPVLPPLSSPQPLLLHLRKLPVYLLQSPWIFQGNLALRFLWEDLIH